MKYRKGRFSSAYHDGLVDVFGSTQPVPMVDFNPGDKYADANRMFGIASSIAKTPGGRLWCGFSSGGEGEGRLNYGIVVVSDDDGVTWTPPVMALDTDGDGSIRTDHITFWTAPDGTLWLFWSQYPVDLCGPLSSQWAITCPNPDADEPSWSLPKKIVDQQNILTTPTVLKDGTWMLPTGCWDRKTSPSRPLISKDSGQSFTLGGPLAVDTPPDFDEYMIVERTDGTLVIYNRHESSFLQCESSDGGMTWTKQRTNGIIHTNSRFVFMKLPSGTWLLVKHGSLSKIADVKEQMTDQKGISQMTAYISDDEGASWRGGLMLDERECSYPFGCIDKDGTVYVSYERERWNQPAGDSHGSLH